MMELHQRCTFHDYFKHYQLWIVTTRFVFIFPSSHSIHTRNYFLEPFCSPLLIQLYSKCILRATTMMKSSSNQQKMSLNLLTRSILLRFLIKLRKGYWVLHLQRKTLDIIVLQCQTSTTKELWTMTAQIVNKDSLFSHAFDGFDRLKKQEKADNIIISTIKSHEELF